MRLEWLESDRRGGWEFAEAGHRGRRLEFVIERTGLNEKIRRYMMPWLTYRELK